MANRTQLDTDDWTKDPATGRSNSSPKFHEISKAVEALIRNDAHMLLAGKANNTAALIVAQLAHVHGLAPRA